MSTATRNIHQPIDATLVAWLPLGLLPLGAAWLTIHCPPWVAMWAIAAATYLGAKWLSYAGCRPLQHGSWTRVLGFLFLWPGMDARAFFGRAVTLKPPLAEWLFAVAKTVCGLWLFFGAAPRLVPVDGYLAAWVGMLGIVFSLHLGLFHLLALAWQSAGVPVRAIMQMPIRATSLGDFWGRRWNLAFRDLAYQHVFRPLLPKLGVAGATLAVFLASGFVHDVVISAPARGGRGMPTLYFLLQAAGLFVERSHWGRRLGLASGAVGRAFAAAMIVVPLPLLFHRPFLERVILPMLT